MIINSPWHWFFYFAEGASTAPLRLWVRSSHRNNDTNGKRVSQRSTESRGFSLGTPVSSHRESWQGGLEVGTSPPNWPFHRSCAPWSDMSHKMAARCALSKPSTGSDWAASFAIQLSSHLRVRMISTPPLTCLLVKKRVSGKQPLPISPVLIFINIILFIW
jgi:hypothetical protein